MLASNGEIKRLKEEVRDLLQFEDKYINWLRLTSTYSDTEVSEVLERRKKAPSLKLSKLNKDYLSKFLNAHIIEITRKEVFF